MNTASNNVHDLSWLVNNWSDIELTAFESKFGTKLVPYHNGHQVKLKLEKMNVASAGPKMYNNRVEEYQVRINLGRDVNAPFVDKLVQLDELAEKQINEMSEDDFMYKPMLQKNSFHRITAYGLVVRSKFQINESRVRGRIMLTHVLRASLYDVNRKRLEFSSDNLAKYISGAKVNCIVEPYWFAGDSGISSSLTLKKIRRLSPVEDDNECDI